MARLGVAMSGGVDSTVTARLLQTAGHQVEGFFLLLAQPDLDAQVARVRAVAARLGVALHLVDLRDAFRARVLGPFVAAYCAGRTPNPCVACNPTIKFGLLLDEARARGCQGLATGHYARLRRDADGVVHLLAARDRAKDQSYFLHRLTQAQLQLLHFPLGEQSKEETRQQAAAFGLAGVHGRESQDVCFLANTTVADFLAAHGGPLPGPGEIVDSRGRPLGRHQGIHRYTVGQRRGLGLPDATPWYVLALDPAANRVVVGKEEELYQKELLAVDCSWTGVQPPAAPFTCTARIRHRHPGAAARVSPAAPGRWRVVFDAPQRAVTPGQYVVFYHDDEVLGGGEIRPATGRHGS